MVEQFNGAKDVAVVIPDSAELDLLAEVSTNLYGRLQVDDLETDHAAAFDLYESVGRGLRDSDALPELSRLLADFATREAFKVLFISMHAHDLTNLPPTPEDYSGPERNPFMLSDGPRALLLGMAGVTAYGYTSQQPGNILNHVIGIKRFADVGGTSGNAKAALDMHSEDASYNKVGAVLPDGTVLDDSYDASPDLLTLDFKRNPYNIPTTVSPIDTMQLSSANRAILKENLFLNLTNPSQGGEENDIDLPISVLYNGTTERPLVRANTSKLVVAPGISGVIRERAQAAIDEMVALMNSSAVALPAQPGDIVIVDNKLAAHGRAPYPDNMPEDAKYGGMSRWQRRVVAAYDPARIAHYSVKDRIIQPTLLGERIEQL